MLEHQVREGKHLLRPRSESASCSTFVAFESTLCPSFGTHHATEHHRASQEVATRAGRFHSLFVPSSVSHASSTLSKPLGKSRLTFAIADASVFELRNRPTLSPGLSLGCTETSQVERKELTGEGMRFQDWW